MATSRRSSPAPSRTARASRPARSPASWCAVRNAARTARIDQEATMMNPETDPTLAPERRSRDEQEAARAALAPLESHAEWRASDIADRAQWTYRLTDDDVAELEAALAHARARCDDVLDITRELFPLPTLADKIRRFEDE